MRTRDAAVVAGLRAAMVKAGVDPDAVRAYVAGSSFRHVDKIVSTDSWRLEGDPALFERAARYILAKERALGIPDSRDGATVEPILSFTTGESAYGELQGLVMTYRFERPRCFVKRAALPLHRVSVERENGAEAPLPHWRLEMSDGFVTVSSEASKMAARVLAGLEPARVPAPRPRRPHGVPQDLTSVLRFWAVTALGLRCEPRGGRRVAVWAMGSEPTGAYGAAPLGVPTRAELRDKILKALESRLTDACARVGYARIHHHTREQRRAAITAAGAATRDLRAARRAFGVAPE